MINSNQEGRRYKIQTIISNPFTIMFHFDVSFDSNYFCDWWDAKLVKKVKNAGEMSKL